MSLLETIVEWDQSSICCETRSHLAADNPLRYKGRLSTLSGIEYAAQAMALHGGLKSAAASQQPEQLHAGLVLPASAAVMPAGARHGYLASVRDAICTVPYLDAVAVALQVRARLLHEEGSRVIYEFELTAANGNETRLLSGRAAVVLA